MSTCLAANPNGDMPSVVCHVAWVVCHVACDRHSGWLHTCTRRCGTGRRLCILDGTCSAHALEPCFSRAQSTHPRHYRCLIQTGAAQHHAQHHAHEHKLNGGTRGRMLRSSCGLTNAHGAVHCSGGPKLSLCRPVTTYGPLLLWCRSPRPRPRYLTLGCWCCCT